MRTQRTFRPTADGLESRDVPAAMGIAAHIAHIPHAGVGARLNTPFAHAVHLGGVSGSRQLTASRTATATNAINALNRLASNLTSNTALNQLNSMLRQFGMGSLLNSNGTLNTNTMAALTRLLSSNTTTTTSLLNNGQNFPATLGSQLTGIGTGLGFSNNLGSSFGGTNMLTTGTGGFVSFM